VGLLVGLCLAVPAANGFINPRFTPVDLVRQSDLILVGSIRATSGPDHWRMTDVKALKGSVPDEPVLSLVTFKRSQVGSLRDVLTHNQDAPVILFAATPEKARRAFLHIVGQWLSAKPAAGGRWEVASFALKMSGVYAGGTDMLVRMSRYILADPGAQVPVSVGTRWVAERCDIATVAGKITGLGAVDPDGDGRMHLFVASSNGDRLYRPKDDDEAFEDVTQTGVADSRSQQFAWVDMDDDGRVDLVSWDGRSIRLHRTARRSAPYVFDGPCLGLAACGAAAVLVSTRDTPFVLARDTAGRWRATRLPEPEGLEGIDQPASACIVADFDNDGFCDVIQPRPTRRILWRGQSGGFAPPTASVVASPDGPCQFTLGDFNQDGYLDIFLTSNQSHELWENDGTGRFRGVSQWAGSLGYKTPVGATGCAATDLNHDGRTDLCLLYADGGFMYHFNRGFRCLGEEGGLRLTDVDNASKEPVGQRACAVADFNQDGSLDLAVAFLDGRVCCYYNDTFGRPGLRVGLAEGVSGPLTVSVWQGVQHPVCVGARSVSSSAERVYFPLRDTGPCTLKWSQPDKPNCIKRLELSSDLPETGLEVVLGE